MFLSLCSPASVFLDQQGGFIGSRYKKVVYRQFTNDKFTKQIERTADLEHLGILGKLSGQQKCTNCDEVKTHIILHMKHRFMFDKIFFKAPADWS